MSEHLPRRRARQSGDAYAGDRLPLDVARDAFRLLVTGPAPLAIDGWLFEGLPDQMVRLDRLRDLLLAPGFPTRCWDPIWAHLVDRARNDGSAWVVGAVGVAAPMLIRISITLTAALDDDRSVDPADVQAEVLAGFLQALKQIDTGKPRVLLRLRWAAYRAGYRAVGQAMNSPRPHGDLFTSTTPAVPLQHPDVVLARAVNAGVLTTAEADLISATRIGNDRLTDWAAEHRAGEWAVYKMRRRAELRLAAWITGSDVRSKNAGSAGLQKCPSPSPEDPAAEAQQCA